MPGWWRRGSFKNCNSLMSWLIFEKKFRQTYQVQFQFIEMIDLNRLESDSLMAPVTQEHEFLELSLEELEGIQGGGWFKKVKKIVKKIAKSLDGQKISIYNSNPNKPSLL